MAKKKANVAAPEMSTLPIKQDDSPIVIDLPDGQKLVVGQLANGSVIEVATWRGTGRPDSRTSRLMLGMSSAAGAQSQAAEDAATKPVAKPNAISILKLIAIKTANQVKSLQIGQFLAKAKNRPSKKSEKPLIKTLANENLAKESDEVGDWLNSILAKSEKKMTVKKTPAKKAAAKKSTGRAR